MPTLPDTRQPSQAIPPFPTQGTALPGTGGGGFDPFIANFDLAGNLKFSGVLGGSAMDFANGIALDSSGAVYVAGSRSPRTFLHPGRRRPTRVRSAASSDGFVAKISPAATTTISPQTNPSTAGQNVTFTVTVTIGGSPAPDGRVRVYDDFSLIRDLVLSPTDNGQLTFLYAPASAGEHRITAYYEPAPASPVDLYSVASFDPVRGRRRDDVHCPLGSSRRVAARRLERTSAHRRHPDFRRPSAARS